MTLGEIKLEAIRLMFLNNTNELSVESITNLMNDENYSSYLVNMRGAINRALDRIRNAKVLTQKSYTIASSDTYSTEYFTRFELSNIADLFILSRVVYEGNNGEYIGECEYDIEGNVLVLNKREGTYRIIYYPKTPYITNDFADTEEINIPDEVARLIPYFIKGDLYQEDEPTLAADARNTFEACLEDLQKQQQSYTNHVVMKYSEIY